MKNETLLFESLQNRLFSQIKSQLNKRHRLAKEVCNTLHIETKSAYRRMNGETALTLEEAVRLAKKFELSLDNIFLHDDYELMSFKARPLIQNLTDVHEYLKDTLRMMRQISVTPNARIMYSAKDMPIFYFFRFPELAAFKIFFWAKTLYNAPELKDKEFHPSLIPQETIDLAHELHDCFINIEVHEIWNHNTFDAVINQLDFYLHSGEIKQGPLAQLLITQLHEVIHSLHTMARTGQRENNQAPYLIYHNEILMMDNNILAILPPHRVFFLSYAGINYLNTHEPEFCQWMEDWFYSQMAKSTLISRVSERTRERYFRNVHDRITELKVRNGLMAAA